MCIFILYIAEIKHPLYINMSSASSFTIRDLIAQKLQTSEITYTTGTLPIQLEGTTIVRITGIGNTITALAPARQGAIQIFVNDSSGDLTLTQTTGANIFVEAAGGAMIYCDDAKTYRALINTSVSSLIGWPLVLNGTGQGVGSIGFEIYNNAGSGISFTIAEDGSLRAVETGGTHQVRLDGNVAHVEVSDGAGLQNIQMRCEGSNDAQLNIFDDKYDQQPVYFPDRALYRFGIERGIKRNPIIQNDLDTTYGFPQGNFQYSTNKGSYGNMGCDSRTLALLSDGIGLLKPSGHIWDTQTAIIVAGRDRCYYDGLQIRGALSGSTFRGIEIPVDFSRGILDVRLHAVGGFFALDATNKIAITLRQADSAGVTIRDYEMGYYQGAAENHFVIDGALSLYSNAQPTDDFGGLNVAQKFVPTDTFRVRAQNFSNQAQAFQEFAVEYRLSEAL